MFGDGVITTVAGSGEQGFSGDGGPAATARLDNPFDLTFDGAGNLYFCDTQNHRVRRIDATTGDIDTLAGNGERGFGGDGGPAIQASLHEPYGLAVDTVGNVYVVDRFNYRVRRIDAVTGVIETIAGNGEATHSGDGGPARAAGLLEPNDVALSVDESLLYIVDPSDHRVRAMDLRTGVIDTIAGNGAAEDSGSGELAQEAGIWGARAVAAAADGTLYIVKKQGLALGAVGRDGRYRPLTGFRTHGYLDGTLDEARFDRPKEICLETPNSLLLVDTEVPAIRRVDLAARRVSTVAGIGNGQHVYNGDGMAATAAALARPHGVAVGADGAIYIGDSENHRIRRVA